MFLRIILFLIIFNVGCATIQDFLFPDVPSNSAKIAWEKDLKMEINGLPYYGTAVVPYAENYQIKIWPSYLSVDILNIKSCHRSQTIKKAIKYGRYFWSKKQEYYVFDFKPTAIERDRSCNLKLEALSQERKSMAFGMVMFPDLRDRLQLSARLECGGITKDYVGKSLCQGPVGSVQRITLPDEVFYDDRPNKDCPPLKKIYSNVFEISIPKDECLYIFKSTKKTEAGEYMEHHFSSFGYEQTPPEEI